MQNAAPRLWTWPFVLICVVHVIQNVAFYISMPIFPLLLDDRFQLTGLIMGVATASYTVSAILTRPPTGYLIDRYGRRIFYLSAYGLFALTYFLYPLAASSLAVTLVRFLHGILWGVTMGTAATVAVDLLPRARQGEGLGYFGLAMVLGMAAGPGIGLWVQERMGYDFLFNAAGLFMLAGFVCLCCLRFPKVPRRYEPITVNSLLERSSLPASLATLMFCLPYGSIMNYTGVHARSLEGASAGTFYLCMAAGTALTRLFSGKVFDRTGPGRVMLWAYALLLAGCFSLAAASGPGVFYIAGLTVGLGYGISIPVMQAVVNSLVPPQRRGAANATLMTAFDLGICLGLLAVSQLQVFIGWGATYGMLFGCVALSAALFRFYALPRYRADLAALTR